MYVLKHLNCMIISSIKTLKRSYKPLYDVCI